MTYFLYTAEQARSLDRLAIESAGIAGYSLMSRAGAEVFSQLRAHWPDAKSLHVVCGTGNNGGDGWVIARLGRMAGLEVMVDLVGKEARIHGDARQAMYDYLQGGGEFRQLDDDSPCDPQNACVVVDALTGIGLLGRMRPEYQKVIARINACGRPVLSVDCPSGINPDTGYVAEHAVRADVTVTFIGRKQGLLTGDAPDYCGDLIFADLGVPDWIYKQVAASAQALTLKDATALLATRKPTAHKGDFGHVLVVAGYQGMGGAGILAAEAALRSGAGLVTLATHPDNVPAALARRPEIMARGVNLAAELHPLIHNASCILIGPGLDQNHWSQALLAAALETSKPLILDADALNLIATGEPLTDRRGPTVITPHPGEAARLLNTTTQHIHQDRFDAAARLARRWGATTVLKGAGTVIAAHDNDDRWVCPYGNPGMASAGMGDVLGGIIAALVAQGLSMPQAAQIGVTVHAGAGDLAAETLGQRSLLASDVITALSQIYRS